MESFDASDVKRRLKTFGEHISELGLGGESNELNIAHLYRLMSITLANVKKLSTFAPSNDVVTPFDTRSVVVD